jgi:cyanophycinase
VTIPKGKLIAIGGNEDKGTYPNPKSKKKYYLDFFELGILKRIVTELHQVNPRIEVITSASMIPEEVAQRYLGAFSILGCTNIGIMHIRSRVDAARPEIMKRLRETAGILFTGGDQSRLADFFGNGEFLEICRDRTTRSLTL